MQFLVGNALVKVSNVPYILFYFFEKEDFLKNGYGYDFETFTNGFLAKN